jgi:hypothetical protein
MDKHFIPCGCDREVKFAINAFIAQNIVLEMYYTAWQVKVKDPFYHVNT